jgi:D-glycero-alpha-D-manno-heptose-7-phosphate kinase
VEIVDIVRRFSNCVTRKSYAEAGLLMNRETEIRLAMTPEVLDPFGRRLAAAAVDLGCGARFAGAGGGGCIWAIGERAGVEALRRRWDELLAERDGARLLKVGVDSDGLLCQL